MNSLRRLSEAKSFPAEAAKFNEQFMGPAGLKVRKDIASPALWNVKALHGLAEQYGASSADTKEIFRDLCKFKWAFRIKPDLVIVMPGFKPICIEGKLESREGTYPIKRAETKMFDDVFGTGAARRVRQVELQDFLFFVLLQREPQLLFIAQKEGKVTIPGRDGTTLTRVPQLRWDQVFKALDTSSSIPFVQEFIGKNRLINRLDSAQSRDAAKQTSSAATPIGHGPTGLKYEAGLSVDDVLSRCAATPTPCTTFVGFSPGKNKFHDNNSPELLNRLKRGKKDWKWHDPQQHAWVDTGNGNWIPCTEFAARVNELK